MEKTITEIEEAIRKANDYLEKADVGREDPDNNVCILSRQLLRAIEREMELKHRLEVVLPMAKAYAYQGEIAPNIEKIEWAEQYVNQITDKTYFLKETLKTNT